MTNHLYYVMRSPRSPLLHFVDKEAVGVTLCGRRVHSWILDSIPLATCYRCRAVHNRKHKSK